MKAIETHYAGCRFRSRLEARWAFFMDLMDVRWEYEHEGWELPSGRYLPDFRLPHAKVHLEIKGETPTQREVNLALELASEACVDGVALPDAGGRHSSISVTRPGQAGHRSRAVLQCHDRVRANPGYEADRSRV